MGTVRVMTVADVTDEVVVRGEGEVRVMPDRAVVQLVVDGDGAGRDEAYAAAARLATQVDAVLVTHEAALDRVATAALLVQPKTQWRRGEAVRTGWRASRTTLLEVTDLPRLGDLMAELAGAGAALTGPDWKLDVDHPAHTEARRTAAADARRRAEAYAGALGLRVERVVWVAEPGLRQGTDHGYGGPMTKVFAAARAGGAEDAAVMDVGVEEITVTAAVEVGFAFAPLAG
jgi:uncharacterized protein YggE